MKIRSLAEGKLRDLCDSLTPERRKAVVIGLCTVFAAVNFYMIFRAIYDIGREDARQEVLGDGGTCAYPDVAGGSAGIVRERVVQVGVDGEDTVCVVEHQLAVCGKGDVSPASVEQGDT